MVCALFMVLFRARYLPEMPQIIFKIFVIGISFIIIFKNHLNLSRNISLLYSLAIIVSCFFNYRGGSISLSNFLNGILYSICVYCIYTVMGGYCSLFGFDNLLKCIYAVAKLYALISIISILIIEHVDNVVYFFGPTFLTNYLLLLWFGLYYLKKRNQLHQANKLKLVLFSIMILGIFVYTQCSTMIVAFGVVIIMMFFPEWLKQAFASPKVLIGIMIAAGLLIFFIEGLLAIPVVQHFIVNILGENLTLTDRLRVYSHLKDLIELKPWAGYGYQNDAIYTVTEWASNAQNGLINILINYGLFGVISFIILCYRSFDMAGKSNDYWGLYVICYGMVVASIVEVSYNYVFIIIICMIRWSNLTQGSYIDKRRGLRKI